MKDEKLERMVGCAVSIYAVATTLMFISFAVAMCVLAYKVVMT